MTTHSRRNQTGDPRRSNAAITTALAFVVLAGTSMWTTSCSRRGGGRGRTSRTTVAPPAGVTRTPAAPARTAELKVASRGGVTLAGTLYLPAGKGPFPAIILTHGSGRDSRKQRGYLRWARRFRSRGIAALAFDKRGVGDSTGKYVEAPDLEVPAADVLAWTKVLARRPDIRKDRIGVMGWSQGGWVGPLAASKSKRLAFVVSISGPGVSPLEQNVFDKSNRARRKGASTAQARQFADVLRRVFTYFATGRGQAQAQAAWDRVKKKSWFKRGYRGLPMMPRNRLLSSKRFQTYVAHLKYEPVPVLRRLRVPMLAVFGGADRIVPVAASIAGMRGAFAHSGHGCLFTARIFPGGDHGIRVKAPAGKKPAPGYPEYVVQWVLDRVAQPAP